MDPNYGGASIDRAKNLYKTVNDWIKRSAMKSLWLDAPWIFDTIIDKHKTWTGKNSGKGSG